MRHNSRTMAVMGYGTPEDQKEGDDLQSTLQVIQDIAPTVRSLVADLPPAEQAAVLKAKIQQLRQYESIPAVGIFARQRIMQYEARLAEVEKSAGHQRQIEMKMNLLYTIGVGLGLTLLVLYGAKTVKEFRN